MPRKFFVLTMILVAICSLLYFLTTLESGKMVVESVKSIPAVAGIFKRETTILLTGDIMLGRSVMTKSLKEGDVFYPFRGVAAEMRKVDIVFSNLENPIVTGCPKTDSGLKFCTDPALAEGLVFAGVDVVTLSNNHILNYGKDGLEETKRILTAKGIAWTGDGNLAMIEKNGTRFGFLGFDFVSKSPVEADYELVRGSKEKVDVLIVGVHWGVEYIDKAGTIQCATARKLVENGADIVSGHHPHWIQDAEIINNGRVYYSLGNFIFDQMWSEKTKKGLTVELTFEGKNLTRESRKEIYIKNIGQPEWVSN